MWRSPVRRASRKAGTVTYPSHQIANGRGCAIPSPTTYVCGRGHDRATRYVRRQTEHRRQPRRHQIKLDWPIDRERPTPQATIEAIMHSVRERGLGSLKEPATIERLSRCDAAARAQVNYRIDRLIERKGL